MNTPRFGQPLYLQKCEWLKLTWNFKKNRKSPVSLAKVPRVHSQSLKHTKEQDLKHFSTSRIVPIVQGNFLAPWPSASYSNSPSIICFLYKMN